MKENAPQSQVETPILEAVKASINKQKTIQDATTYLSAELLKKGSTYTHTKYLERRKNIK